eukprot:scaffold87565_cov31-Tisochrysis_lutea.AAC.3
MDSRGCVAEDVHPYAPDPRRSTNVTRLLRRVGGAEGKLEEDDEADNLEPAERRHRVVRVKAAACVGVRGGQRGKQGDIDDGTLKTSRCWTVPAGHVEPSAAMVHQLM